MPARKKKIAKKKTKARSRKTVGTSLEMHGEVTLEVNPLSENARKPNLQSKYDVLRLEAGLLYITCLDKISVADVYKDARFKGVPEQTFRSWAVKDRWVDRRKAMFADVQDRLAKEAARTLSEALHAEVNELLDIRKQANSMLNIAGATEPPKGDAVVKAILQINKRLDDLREKALSSVLPEEKAATPQQADPVQLKYDAAEIRAAAKAITAQRRERIRAASKEIVQKKKEGKAS